MSMERKNDSNSCEKQADRDKRTGKKETESKLIPLLEAARGKKVILSIELNGGGQDGRKA